MSRLRRNATVNKARVSDFGSVPDISGLLLSKQGGTTDY